MIPRLSVAKQVEEEIELSDEDLIEVTPPQPRSGTYALGEGQRTIRPSPPLDALPSVGSISDGLETSVNDVVTDLARLSDPSSTPRICGEVDWASLDAAEAWLVTLIEAHMTVGAILETSPRGEEDTLRLLARLIGLRVVTLA